MAETNIPTIVLSYKYRLLPNKKQHGELLAILESQRKLYNDFLSDRIETYKHTGKTLSCFDQFSIAVIQKLAYPANLNRATIKRLDEACKGFFRRIKAGQKAGFPRFRGKGWWDSFGFAEFSGIQLKGKRLYFKGLSGGLRVHFHRQLPETKILSCTFNKDVKGWSVSFQIRVLCAGRQDEKSVGIDVGIKDLAILSTGEHIPNIKATKRHERELRRRQRALSRCRRGSKNRTKAKARVARIHAKIANTRATYLHQISARLAREFSSIAFEDLNIKGMVKNHCLAKSISDASWAKLIQFTSYKAARAGGSVELVNPIGTTQECSGCGCIVPKKLADRWHVCPHCGLSIDRDENAALNILARSGAIGGQRKEVSYAFA